jgi:hypothetical protein
MVLGELFLFQLLYPMPNLLRLIILLQLRQIPNNNPIFLPLLRPQLQYILRKMYLRLEFQLQLRRQIIQLLHMLILQPLQTLQGDLLVLPHIQIPVVTELFELFALDLFDVVELFDVGYAEEVAFADALFLFYLLDFYFAFFGLFVVAVFLAFFTVLVEEFQEADQSAICF